MPNGKIISKKINEFISKNSNIKIHHIYLEPNKSNLSLINLIPENKLNDIKDKIIIFVDDVINTGETLFYAINQFIEFNPKGIQIAVLVERNYNKFPIVPDYRGIRLSTSKKEHVKVELDEYPKVIIK